MVRAFLKNESGATAIEYGLIAGLIFLAIVGAISATMGSTDGMYQIIGNKTGQVLNN